MCLLITAFAALICAFMRSRNDSRFLSNLYFMYVSAALMWTVDCVFAKVGGEDFFDLSLDDTLLGITIVVSGAVMASLISVLNSVRARA
ncbi:MAG: hypothetical protein ACI4UM_03575 [Succinivibrio sp.]